MSAASAVIDPIRTRLRIATLDRWADAGVALARRLMAEARRDLAEASRVLARIAQAVRIATLLATRLEQPDNPAFQPRPARPRAARAAEAQVADAQVAEAQANPEQAATERVQAEKPDRPRGVGFAQEREIPDDVILRRPLKDIVKFICKALGVAPDWSLWADDAPAAASAPSPDPAPAPPKPRSRPLVCLHHPLKRPADWPPGAHSLRTRLRCACAAGALVPIILPIAVPAIGRFRPGAG